MPGGCSQGKSSRLKAERQRPAVRMDGGSLLHHGRSKTDGGQGGLTRQGSLPTYPTASARWHQRGARGAGGRGSGFHGGWVGAVCESVLARAACPRAGERAGGDPGEPGKPGSGVSRVPLAPCSFRVRQGRRGMRGQYRALSTVIGAEQRCRFPISPSCLVEGVRSGTRKRRGASTPAQAAGGPGRKRSAQRSHARALCAGARGLCGCGAG